MSQDLTQKQGTWVRRWTGAVTQLLDLSATLMSLQAEYASLGYAPGAPPVGDVSWNLTDAAVQAVLPSGTAAQVEASVGGVQSVEDVISANMGYLQPMRP